MFIFADVRVVAAGQYHKFMALKWFEITTNSINRVSSFFFNIKLPARHILTVQKTTSNPLSTSAPDSPLSSLLTPSPKWWPNQSTCYFQLALNFLCEKYFGLSIQLLGWLVPFEQESVTDAASSYNYFA